MSDLIDFALSTITDYTGFEYLATEIMQEEGFHDIKPLGGVSDYGLDAKVEKIYENIRENYIFQYSIDKNSSNKIIQTIKKLFDNKIAFNIFVYVTPTQITSSVQEDLIKKVRVDYKKNLLIYERKKIKAVLANSSNKIYVRHFPDIEKQIAAYSANTSDLSLDDRNILEMEMLKVNITFVHNEEAHNTRKRIYDNLVLSIINAKYPSRMSQKNIEDEIIKIIPGKEYTKSKLPTALVRLEKNGSIELEKGGFKTNDQTHHQFEIDTHDAIEKLNILVSDIVNLAKENHQEPLSDDTLQRANRNVRRALIAYFQAFGFEITSQFAADSKTYPVFQKSVSIINEECGRQIGAKLGQLLFDSIGEILASPSDEHIDAIHYLVISHVTNAIMVLDPNLKEFQSTNFSTKTFILDTDFLVNCIIPELTQYSPCIQLVTDLIALGAKVVIPDSSIDECVVHASSSVNTYNYFNSNLLSLPESLAGEKIYNAFVRGYYYSIKSGKLHPAVRYSEYLKNYYDSGNPLGFMKEVIKTYVPDGVQYINVSDIYTGEIEDSEYEKVFTKMLELTQNTVKGKYRDKEENELCAEVDTSLFLATLHSNTEATKDTILGGSHYLLTNSGKYRIVSSNLGYKDSISTRPQSLMSILTSIGASSISKVDLIKTLENPLLLHAVQENWEDIGKLIKFGFDLSKMNLPRLRSVLEGNLHNMLTKVDPIKKSSDSKEFEALLKETDKLGIALPPSGIALKEKLKEQEKTIKELEEILASKEELEKEIHKFGKRRQKYLRRISSSAKK